MIKAEQRRMTYQCELADLFVNLARALQRGHDFLS
jgi:hypothetical protein